MSSACRNALASDLRAIGCDVKVQEDFQQGPRTLIEKLEEYIANCDRVIMLVGRAYGFEASGDKVPKVDPPRSYTQWEYYFALGERLSGKSAPTKDLYLYLASESFLDAITLTESPERAERQQGFIHRIKASGKDRSPFDSLDQLCRLVLRDGWQMNDRPQRTRVPFQLPKRALAGELFGRADLLFKLVDRLKRGESVDIWGPPGMGKTALAAEAIWQVVGDDPELLYDTRYPDGVVLLDLSGLKPQDDATPVWNSLANAFDESIPTTMSARDRALKGCAGRHALVVVEGAEQARTGDELHAILEVLSVDTTQLVLTRNKAQINPNTALFVDSELDRHDSLTLLHKLCGAVADAAIIENVYDIFNGHPLGLTWAGSQIAATDEPPELFLADLKSEKLPSIHEPGYESRTLRWLYDRSVKHLSADARNVLSGAGMLAQDPFPLSAAVAVTGKDRTARDALLQIVRHGFLRLSDDKKQWQFTHALAHRYAASNPNPDLLALFGRWAEREFDESILEAKDSGNLARLSLILNHSAALLGADLDERLLEQLRSKLTYDGLEAITSIGRLDLARVAAMASFEWTERMVARAPLDGDLLRELSVSYDNLGNIHSAAGDLNAARQAFQQSLDIADKLAKSDPSNSQWQRDLSVSYNKLGDIHPAAGDLNAARLAFQQSLDIADKLAKSDPSNSQWQRDLVVSFAKIGVLLAQLTQRGEALQYLERARAISARLVELDPVNATWKNDLAWVEERIANLD